VDNEKLTGLIRQSFAASDRTYGSRRVWQDVREWGHCVSVNRVARLMAAAGLVARRKRRRRPGDSAQATQHTIAPNLLQRQFEADAPNRRWLADFTYIWTAEGWLYLAVVLDLFSRRDSGLVDERRDDLAAGDRRLADGDLAPRQPQGTAAPLRPGFSARVQLVVATLLP
jgi:transposase InsO family protein